jgi:hypothetical protein
MSLIGTHLFALARDNYGVWAQQERIIGFFVGCFELAAALIRVRTVNIEDSVQLCHVLTLGSARRS